MIHFLRGILDTASLDSAVLDVAGVGYRVMVPLSTAEKLPDAGREVKLYIVESMAMYGGSTTLYGFLTAEERDIFLLLKEEVPGAGAKKALDYLDKVTKSLPDFRRVIVEKDIAALTGIFGFTRKTAEKLVAALKDKIGAVSLGGAEKWAAAAAPAPSHEAVAALMALGYREIQAREAVEKAVAAAGTESLATADVVTRALKQL